MPVWSAPMGATVRTAAVAEDRGSSDPERADQPSPPGDQPRPWFPPAVGQPPTGFTEPPGSPDRGEPGRAPGTDGVGEPSGVNEPDGSSGPDGSGEAAG